MVLLNNDGRNFAIYMSRAGRLRGGRRNANFFLIALQNLNRLYLPKSIHAFHQGNIAIYQH